MLNAQSILNDIESTQKKLVFWPGAKAQDARYASTHAVCNIVVDGKLYQTVMHYVSAQKYNPQDRHLFQGKTPKFKNAKEARSAGAPPAMRKLLGYSMTDTVWKRASPDFDEDYYNIRAYKHALWARYQQDARFRRILTEYTYFARCEKSRGEKTAEWGCHEGKGINILGNLYHELAAFGEVEQFFELKNGKLNWTGSIPGSDELRFFSYPRNTFDRIREHGKYGQVYDSCGYKVVDSDVVHPFKDASIILHA